MITNNGALPNLVIIGAMKCGTTSLHEYLNLHPQICMSRVKEPEFFIKNNWQKGLNWYGSIFDYPAPVTGESSTSYTKFPIFQGVPERMANFIPDAKLIYLVRDPVKRIISQYIHHVAYYGEDQSLEEAVNIEGNEYIPYSKYFLQLSKYLDYYPTERICIVPFEELMRDKIRSMRRLFEFLEVDPSFESEGFSQVNNSSAEKRRPNGSLIERPQIGEALKQRFIELLHEDIDRFRRVTRMSFDSWCL